MRLLAIESRVNVTASSELDKVSLEQVMSDFPTSVKEHETVVIVPVNDEDLVHALYPICSRMVC
ncbi:hypothetical protein D3C80_2159060 [compost metagenome]